MKLYDIKWSKIFLPGLLLFLALTGTKSASAASYRLGTDTNTTDWTTSPSRGTWGNWIDCEDFSGENSAPRTFSMWLLPDQGNYEKAKFYCRQIQSDGTFESDQTASDLFFNTSDTGSTEDKTYTSMSKLPVGLVVAQGMNNTLSGFSFYENSPAEIMALDEGDVGRTAVSSIVGNRVDPSAGLRCSGNYVMTGMRLKTDDAIWPYNGKVLTGIKLRCTELLEE